MDGPFQGRLGQSHYGTYYQFHPCFEALKGKESPFGKCWKDLHMCVLFL